jgi:hypothetical protein
MFGPVTSKGSVWSGNEPLTKSKVMSDLRAEFKSSEKNESSSRHQRWKFMWEGGVISSYKATYISVSGCKKN